MSLRLRLLLITLAVYLGGGYFITRWVIDQVRPRYLESMEETLVDTSVLLAGILEHDSGPNLEIAAFRDGFARAEQHQFSAEIFSLHKTQLDLRVYVTNATGRVVFDSSDRDEGKDYSRWNDVARTLRGAYGARSTHLVPHDDDTQTMYVAAPIRRGDRIIGVVSVGKPTREINDLVAKAQRRIVLGAVTGGGVLLLLLVLAMNWVISPLERLTDYARAIRDGRQPSPPALPGKTLQQLGTAFEEMRDALEGRQHAERYTRALAHEIKAPLAAIRGAAELLDEQMPAPERTRFLGNIRQEGARIQRIVERLLELSSLEARKTLGTVERVDVRDLAREIAANVEPVYAAHKVALDFRGETAVSVNGDRFLLGQAIKNLLQNAVEFAPSGSTVEISTELEGSFAVIAVEDSGPGIPEYALPRVFERFYSLPRPGTGVKSTGIGLPLVREIAHLHGGEVTVCNRVEGGVRAELRLPRA